MLCFPMEILKHEHYELPTALRNKKNHSLHLFFILRERERQVKNNNNNAANTSICKNKQLLLHILGVIEREMTSEKKMPAFTSFVYYF